VPLQVVAVEVNEQVLNVRVPVVPPGFLETETDVVIPFIPVTVTVVDPTWLGCRGPIDNGLALTLKSTTVAETLTEWERVPD